MVWCRVISSGAEERYEINMLNDVSIPLIVAAEATTSTAAAAATTTTATQVVDPFLKQQQSHTHLNSATQISFLSLAFSAPNLA